MTVKEARDFLYELTSEFFPGATVRWAKTKGVAPIPPFVTISCGSLERDTFPAVDEDGYRSYGCSMRWEVNVYTEGASVDDGSGSDSYVYENTAMDDLEEFVRFMDSPYGQDRLQSEGICIMRDTAISDLSEFTGDTRYNYRAMVEFVVTFTESGRGEYGLYAESLPNASGGGTEAHSETDDLVFTGMTGSGTIEPSGTEINLDITQEE